MEAYERRDEAWRLANPQRGPGAGVGFGRGRRVRRRRSEPTALARRVRACPRSLSPSPTRKRLAKKALPRLLREYRYLTRRERVVRVRVDKRRVAKKDIVGEHADLARYWAYIGRAEAESFREDEETADEAAAPTLERDDDAGGDAREGGGAAQPSALPRDPRARVPRPSRARRRAARLASRWLANEVLRKTPCASLLRVRELEARRPPRVARDDPNDARRPRGPQRAHAQDGIRRVVDRGCHLRGRRVARPVAERLGGGGGQGAVRRRRESAPRRLERDAVGRGRGAVARPPSHGTATPATVGDRGERYSHGPDPDVVRRAARERFRPSVVRRGGARGAGRRRVCTPLRKSGLVRPGGVRVQPAVQRAPVGLPERVGGRLVHAIVGGPDAAAAPRARRSRASVARRWLKSAARRFCGRRGSCTRSTTPDDSAGGRGGRRVRAPARVRVDQRRRARSSRSTATTGRASSGGGRLVTGGVGVGKARRLHQAVTRRVEREQETKKKYRDARWNEEMMRATVSCSCVMSIGARGRRSEARIRASNAPIARVSRARPVSRRRALALNYATTVFFQAKLSS